MTFVHSLAIVQSRRHDAEGKRIGKSSGLAVTLEHYLSQENNAVILLIDDGKANRTVRRLEQASRKSGPARKDDFPEAYIESGKLVLLETAHFRPKRASRIDSELVIQKWREAIATTKRKSTCPNVVVISDCSLILRKLLGNKLCRQIEYERKIKEFNHNQEAIARKLGLTEAVCCYSGRTIDKMPIRFLIPLISNHDSMLDFFEPNEHTVWRNIKIQHLISQGINNVMGRDADKLVFQTMKVFYGIDRDKIVAHPDLFEAKLTKILGESAKMVLESIASQFRKELYADSEGNYAIG